MATPANTFETIYKYNLWGSGSGSGSWVWNNQKYIAFLQDILNTYNITSVLDIGCGDYSLWTKINYSGKYLGIDVVESVINQNMEKHSITKADGRSVEFKTHNLLLDHLKLPNNQYIDLVIIKDLLIHLPNNDIHILLDKVANKVKPKYILICEDTPLFPYFNFQKWINIKPGMYRPINFNYIETNNSISLKKLDSLKYIELTYLLIAILILMVGFIKWYWVFIGLLFLPVKKAVLYSNVYKS